MNFIHYICLPKGGRGCGVLAPQNGRLLRARKTDSDEEREAAFSDAAAVVGSQPLDGVVDHVASPVASDAEVVLLASMPVGWTAMRWLAFVRHSHGGNLEAALAAAERAAADERRRSVAALLDPDVGKVSAPSSRRF